MHSDISSLHQNLHRLFAICNLQVVHGKKLLANIYLLVINKDIAIILSIPLSPQRFTKKFNFRLQLLKLYTNNTLNYYLYFLFLVDFFTRRF